MMTRPQLTDRIMEMLGTDANEHDAALVFETLLDDGKITRDANGYALAPDADAIAAWETDWRPSPEGLAAFAAGLEEKRRASLYPELLAVLEQATVLMPLGTKKRAEWNNRASLLVRKANGRL